MPYSVLSRFVLEKGAGSADTYSEAPTDGALFGLHSMLFEQYTLRVVFERGAGIAESDLLRLVLTAHCSACTACYSWTMT